MSALPATRHDSDSDLSALIDAMLGDLEIDYEHVIPEPIETLLTAEDLQAEALATEHRRKQQEVKAQEKQRAKVSAKRAPASSSQSYGDHAFAIKPPSSTPVSLSSPPSQPSSSSSTITITSSSSTTCLHVPANLNLNAWADTTEAEKLTIIGTFALLAGAIAFTVHMSAKKQASLRRAAAAGKDIRQSIADDIARRFRKLGLTAPPFMFGIEIAPVTGKIHIHGFYIPEGDTPAYFDQVRDAFTHALGKIKGQSGSTQYWSKELETPDRWVRYFTKAEHVVRRQLRITEILYTSRTIRQFARDRHEAARKPAPVAIATPVAAPVEQNVTRITGKLTSAFRQLTESQTPASTVARPGDSLTASSHLGLPVRSTSPPRASQTIDGKRTYVGAAIVKLTTQRANDSESACQ